MEFKTIKLADARLKFASDKPGFTGYASVFGVKDDVGDVVHRGAYAEVLAANDEVKMYFNHGWLKGELPIGKMRLAEDEYGLAVKSVEFTEGIKLAGEVASAVRHGTVDGLSVAISSDGEGIKRRSDGVDWHRVKRLREVSVVAEPANDAARILSVKAALEEAGSLKDIEAVLRDVGLSRADACALVARVKSLAHGERDAERKQKEELLAFARKALLLQP
jgi:HK97 family phage prohead protease